MFCALRRTPLQWTRIATSFSGHVSRSMPQQDAIGAALVNLATDRIDMRGAPQYLDLFAGGRNVGCFLDAPRHRWCPYGFLDPAEEERSCGFHD